MSLTTAPSHNRTYSGAREGRNRRYGKPPLKRQNQLWFPADQRIAVMLYWHQFCSAPLAPATSAGYAAAVKPGKNRSAKTNDFFNSFQGFPYKPRACTENQ